VVLTLTQLGTSQVTKILRLTSPERVVFFDRKEAPHGRAVVKGSSPLDWHVTTHLNTCAGLRRFNCHDLTCSRSIEQVRGHAGISSPCLGIFQAAISGQNSRRSAFNNTDPDAKVCAVDPKYYFF